MKRCKITILQRTLNEKLAREYAAPGFTKCPMMRGTGLLCGLCQTRRFLRRSVEGGLSICIRPVARRRKVLFRRLDHEGRRGDLFLQRRTPPGNHEDRAYGRGLLDLLRTGGVISEVRAERVRIFQNGAADSTPAAPFLILRPNSPTLLRYSLRLGSMQFPALRPALPERLRGWVVLRGRSSHPADSPPIRRDNTTLTRKMRRVLPEAT